MRNLLILASIASMLAGCAPSSLTKTSPLDVREPLRVRVLAINDLHGNLLPPKDPIKIDVPGAGKQEIRAGGVQRLATRIAELKAGHPHHVVVAAGDLVGASPLMSAAFHDEPTIESLNLMGLELSAVGNHEFDQGVPELLRKQNGGCHPDGCTPAAAPFAGARFRYLAASTIQKSTGKPLFQAYDIKQFDGIPVAFIGLALEGTPGLVMKDKLADWRFEDEADTINRLTDELHGKGVKAIVVLIHEGGEAAGGDGGGACLKGPIVDIAKGLKKGVDLIVSGHTHKQYNCMVDGLRITSAHRYGTYVTSIDLLLDRGSRDVIATEAENHLVRPELAEDGQQTGLIAVYRPMAEKIGNRIVGKLAAGISKDPDAAGASMLGQLIADAQLAATQTAGARIALMNPGGIRAPLVSQGGNLTYGDVYEVQPFQNILVTKTLSGAQLLRVLEQQWLDRKDAGIILQVSRGFTYQWDSKRPLGQRVVPGSARLDGKPIDPQAAYRVTANAFLAEGGDGFPAFAEGADPIVGITDLEALSAYLGEGRNLAGDGGDRILRMQ